MRIFERNRSPNLLWFSVCRLSRPSLSPFSIVLNILVVLMRFLALIVVIYLVGCICLVLLWEVSHRVVLPLVLEVTRRGLARPLTMLRLAGLLRR